MLSRRTIVLLSSVLLVGAVHATNTQQRTTPANLQNMLAEDCAKQMSDAGVASLADARRLCTCTHRVQANSLKLGEFWEIQSAMMNGTNPETIAAFRRIKPELERCRQGVRINQPTQQQQR